MLLGGRSILRGQWTLRGKLLSDLKRREVATVRGNSKSLFYKLGGKHSALKGGVLCRYLNIKQRVCHKCNFFLVQSIISLPSKGLSFLPTLFT